MANLEMAIKKKFDAEILVEVPLIEEIIDSQIKMDKIRISNESLDVDESISAEDKSINKIKSGNSQISGDDQICSAYVKDGSRYAEYGSGNNYNDLEDAKHQSDESYATERKTLNSKDKSGKNSDDIEITEEEYHKNKSNASEKQSINAKNDLRKDIVDSEDGEDEVVSAEKK